MTAKAEKAKGRTLQDFRAAHDKSFIVPQKIRDGLKALGQGWEYEVEFIRRCGLSTTDLSRFRDDFEDHIVVTAGRNPKRVWSGSKSLVAQMREMVEQSG